jgi:hypothetical protein
MLTLASVGPVKPARVKFDQYIPLDVEWQGSREGDVAFWRLVTRSSHLEVRLWEDTGGIRDLEIVSVREVKRQATWQLPSVRKNPGLPRFRLDERFDPTKKPSSATWVFVDENIDFAVWLATGRVSVTFGSEVDIDHIVSCQDTHFGFAQDGRWCAFVLDGVSEANMRLIDSTCARSEEIARKRAN